MKGDVKREPGPEDFRQTKPCSDCPFLKVGGERHGAIATLEYASYFTQEPSVTFPCHQTRRRDQDNSEWQPWSEGQTICAGGLIFAEKVGHPNRLLQMAKELGWYKPEDLRGQDTVCDSFTELFLVNVKMSNLEDLREELP